MNQASSYSELSLPKAGLVGFSVVLAILAIPLPAFGAFLMGGALGDVLYSGLMKGDAFGRADMIALLAPNLLAYVAIVALGVWNAVLALRWRDFLAGRWKTYLLNSIASLALFAALILGNG